MGHLFFTFAFLLILLGLSVACGPSNKVTVRAQAMQFRQAEIKVEVGHPITLQLINKDGYTHAFGLDEFELHAPLSANG